MFVVYICGKKVNVGKLTRYVKFDESVSSDLVFTVPFSDQEVRKIKRY